MDNIRHALQKLMFSMFSSDKKNDNNISEEEIKKSIPFEKIKIKALDVADNTLIPYVGKYLISYQKIAGEYVDKVRLFEEWEEALEKYENISLQSLWEKENKNPNSQFSKILKIEKTEKYLYDGYLYIWADFL